MNKSIIGIVLLGLLLLGGWFLYNTQYQTTSLPASDPGVVVPSSPETAPTIDPSEVDGL